MHGNCSNRIQSRNRISGAIQEHWLYLRKLMHHGAAIASAAPSSRWVARDMLYGIDFPCTSTVVELGAGTGPITAEILRAAGGRCRCLIVERDRDFCRLLRARFPAAEVIEADALDYRRLLDDRGVGRVDHVLCELPLPWFTPEARHQLLGAVCDRLTDGGSFRQLTRLPGLHRALYEPYFDDIRVRVILRNLPPAGCYICREPRLR